QIQCSLVEFELKRVVAEVGEGEAGFAVHPHGGAAQMQFCTRFLVRPDAVCRGQRTVNRGLDPVVDTAGLHGNFSAHVLQACNARRRIVRKRDYGCEGNEQQRSENYAPQGSHNYASSQETKSMPWKSDLLVLNS